MATKKATTTTKKTPAKKPSTAKRTTTTRASATTAPANATKVTFVGTVKTAGFWRALAAEFIGTFLLAGVVIAGQGQPIFVLFALVGIVLLIGAVSGAHVNPAITIGAWATRRIGWLRALGYIIAQVLGALIAYVVLNAFIGGAEPVTAQAAAYGQQAPALFHAADVAQLGGKEWFVFFAELLGVSILAFAVANATREVQDRLAAAFTVGLGIFIALMVAVTAASYVGASAIINPAVAVALQAYSWNWWPFAIYALAPIIGGVAGFVLYDLVRGKNS